MKKAILFFVAVAALLLFAGSVSAQESVNVLDVCKNPSKYLYDYHIIGVVYIGKTIIDGETVYMGFASEKCGIFFVPSEGEREWNRLKEGDGIIVTGMLAGAQKLENGIQALVYYADNVVKTSLNVLKSPTPKAKNDSPVLVVRKTVNVRAGPGTEWAILGSIPAGTTVVDVLGKNYDESWWAITFNGRQAWIVNNKSIVVLEPAESIGLLPIIPEPTSAAPKP